MFKLLFANFPYMLVDGPRWRPDLCSHYVAFLLLKLARVELGGKQYNEILSARVGVRSQDLGSLVLPRTCIWADGYES